MQLVVDNQEELLEQPLVEEIIKESLADQVEEPVVASIDKEAVFEPFVAADKGILTVSNKKLFYCSTSSKRHYKLNKSMLVKLITKKKI